MSVIRTYTGRNFNLLDPKIEDIDIRDIAHGLANKCRFSGFTREYYSVSQHSIHVSQFCIDYPMEGLLHDGAEGYLTDLPTPVKRLCPRFKEAENTILSLILCKYAPCSSAHDLGCLHPEVHEVDRRMLTTEAHQLMFGDTDYWAHPAFSARAYDIVIDPLVPKVAEQLFLTRFQQLGGKL